MSEKTITHKQQKIMDEMVTYYESRHHLFKRLAETLQALFTNAETLTDYVHSMKWRVKEPTHLRDKLVRKFVEANAEGKILNITKNNLFYKINDLAGFRILHLYTHQFEHIHEALLDLFNEERYRLVERPTAKTWDDESREYFRSLNIKTQSSSSMYTSVHYIVEPNRQTKITAEIQVRTLAEEIWGEVSHKVNYPHSTSNVSCSEQIKVLARVTSSCSRLVDSIFKSEEIFRTQQAMKQRARRRRA
jgi:putative GTP pyrophosphokinase